MKKIIFYFLISFASYFSVLAQDITAIYYNETQDLIAWATPDSINSKITFAKLNGEILCELPFSAKYASLKLDNIETLYVKDRSIFVLRHQFSYSEDLRKIQHSRGISIFDIKNEKLLIELFPQPDRPVANFSYLQIYPERDLVSISFDPRSGNGGIYILNYKTGEITFLDNCYYIKDFDDGILYTSGQKEFEGSYLFYDFDKKVKYEKIKIERSVPDGVGMVINGQPYIFEQDRFNSKLYQWNRKKGQFKEVDIAIADNAPKRFKAQYYIKSEQEKDKILSTATFHQIALIINNPSEIKRIKDQGEIVTIDFLLSWENKLGRYKEGEVLFQKLAQRFRDLNPKQMGYLMTKKSSLNKMYYKQYIEWLQTSSEQTLAIDGLNVNKSRVKICEDYMDLIKKKAISEEYWVNVETIDAVKSKLQPLTQEFYYMSDSTLTTNAEQKILSAKLIGTSAAVMAVPYYLELERREPKNYIHQMKLGDTYLLAGQYSTANQYYQKVLGLKPNYTPALYGQFMCLYTPFKKGEVSINEQLSKDITTSASKLKTASADYLNEKTEALGISSFFQLYLSDRATYEEYTVAQNTTGTQARIAAFESIIPKLKASNNTMLIASTKYVLASEYLQLAGPYGDSKYYTTANDLVKQAIAGGVDLPALYLLRAQINLDFLNNPTEAIAIIKAGKVKFPAETKFIEMESQYYFGIGRAQYNSKSYTQAIVSIEKYLVNNEEPAIRALQMLGYSYLQLKNYSKAIDYLEKTKERFHSDNTLNAYFPGFEKVLAFAKSPIGNMPPMTDNGDKIEANQNKFDQGKNLHEEGKNEMAIKLMEEALSYFEEINYQFGISLASKSLGALFFSLEKYDQALPKYQKCIDSDPTSVVCYTDKARLYMNLKDYDMALATLDKANEQIAGNEDIQFEYANIWADRGYQAQEEGNNESAVNFFKKSLTYNDKNAMVHMSLGLAYYSQNSKHFGVKPEIRKALQLDSSLEKQFPVLRQILNQ